MSETATREIQHNIPVECPDYQVSKLPKSRSQITDPEFSEEPLLETFTNPLAEEDEDEDLSPALVIDPDLEVKVRRACERISENVHICANEPSLAFYRLSEHVRKALPPTVESRQQVHIIQRQLGAAYEDADTALEEVQSMEQAAPALNSTLEMLRSAISLQQQLKQEQSKRSVGCSENRQNRRKSFRLPRVVS